MFSACGTMGIGSNKIVNINNNSDNQITATGEMGTIKIEPKTSKSVESKNDIILNSSNKRCNSPIIQRKPNSVAIILDVFPGLILGIIPILADAVTDNLYKLPAYYNYEC